MTSLKLPLILTDNYNTYLTMNRSRTCVDWFLTFKAKKKNILRLTVIIVIKLISKVKKSEIYKVKKQTAGLTVLLEV